LSELQDLKKLVNNAELAYVLFQAPVLVAFHAAEMLAGVSP